MTTRDFCAEKELLEYIDSLDGIIALSRSEVIRFAITANKLLGLETSERKPGPVIITYNLFKELENTKSDFIRSIIGGLQQVIIETKVEKGISITGSNLSQELIEKYELIKKIIGIRSIAELARYSLNAHYYFGMPLKEFNRSKTKTKTISLTKKQKELINNESNYNKSEIIEYSIMGFAELITKNYQDQPDQNSLTY